MAKVIAKIDPNAVDKMAVRDEVIAVANAVVPPPNLPFFNIIEVGGEPSVVQITLPDYITGQELVAIRQAILDNVSGLVPVGKKVVTSPYSLTDGVESFEDETSGQTVATLGLLDLVASSRSGPVITTLKASNAHSTNGLLALEQKLLPSQTMVDAPLNFYSSLMRGDEVDVSAYDGLKTSFKFRISDLLDVTGGLPGAVVPDGGLSMPNMFINHLMFVGRIGLSITAVPDNNNPGQRKWEVMTVIDRATDIAATQLKFQTFQLRLNEWIVVTMEYTATQQGRASWTLYVPSRGIQENISINKLLSFVNDLDVTPLFAGQPLRSSMSLRQTINPPAAIYSQSIFFDEFAIDLLNVNL